MATDPCLLGNITSESWASHNCSNTTWIEGYGASNNQSLLLELNNIYSAQSRPLISFMGFLMGLGIPGNFVVLWVYTYKKSKSVANYFMLSLAWVDFCACLVLHPYIIHKYHSFYTANAAVCKIMEYLVHTMLAVQMGILCSVAVDRYYAVCKPLRFIYFYNRAVVMVIGSTIGGAVISLPLLAFYGHKTVSLDLSDRGVVYGKVCHYNDTFDGSLSATLFMGVTVILMIGILCAMIVLYMLVIAEVCRKHRVVYPARDIKSTSTKDSIKDNKTTANQINTVVKMEIKRKGISENSTTASGKTSQTNISHGEITAGSNVSHNYNANEAEESHMKQETEMPNGSNQAESDGVTTASAVKANREKQALPFDSTMDPIVEQALGCHGDKDLRVSQCVKVNSLMTQTQKTEGPELEQSSTREITSMEKKLEINGSNIKSPYNDFCATATCLVNDQLSCSLVPILIFRKSSLRTMSSPRASVIKTVTFDEESYVFETCSSGEVQETLDKSTPKQKSTSVFCPGLKAAKMLSVVTVLFFLSWLPFWILRVESLSQPDIWTLQSLSGSVLFRILNHMFYLNNSINPLIYSLINKNFRKDFKVAWSKCFIVKICKRKGDKGQKKAKKPEENY